MNFLVNPVFFFFSHPVESSAYHAPPTVSGRTAIQLNRSWCWGLIYLLDDSSFPQSLASKEWTWGTLPHSQWEMAICPLANGQSHSWTQLVGFCCYQEASDLGHYSRRVKCEMPWHPALPFFYSPSFPWSNLLLHSGRGNRGSGQDSCSPRHSGSSLLSTAEAKCHW